jgi:diguanylate cyclase (GGDEF)-like protein
MNSINVLFVDDESLTLNAVERILHKSSYSRFYAYSGVESLEKMALHPIHVLVTDMRMPEMDGISLLEKVKELYPDTVRIAFSAYTMTSQLIPCINTGEIYRFISKPVNPHELRKAVDDAIDYHLIRKDRIELVNELKEKNKKLEEALEHQMHVELQLRQMTVTDSLTGLFNRRYLSASLNPSFEHCLRYQNGLSCLMIDLDNFKQINDTYGHAHGDFILGEFASRLKKEIRSADMAFRYGGEEFVVLLPHTDLENAKVIAGRILASSLEKPYEYDERSITVTVSIGMACFKTHAPKTADDLLKTADKMLYMAKNRGRNQICYQSAS